MNRNTLSDYERISRISVDSVMADMYSEIEKLEILIQELEKENDNLRYTVKYLDYLSEQVQIAVDGNTELKEKIRILESEITCLRFPNKPSEFFEIS